jgi:hypothetical protein
VYKKQRLLLGLSVSFLTAAAMTGCQPKTASEKAEDKIEDAAHNAEQGVERAGEKVEDATKN